METKSKSNETTTRRNKRRKRQPSKLRVAGSSPAAPTTPHLNRLLHGHVLAGRPLFYLYPHRFRGMFRNNPLVFQNLETHLRQVGRLHPVDHAPQRRIKRSDALCVTDTILAKPTNNI